MEMNKKIVIVFLAMMLFFTAAGFDSNVIQAAAKDTDITEDVVGQCDYGMSGFMYHSTFYYNEKVEKVVLTAGTIILTHKLPWFWAQASVQIANTWNTLMGSNIYITQTYYTMFVENGSSIKPDAAEKTITRYYADSPKTKFLDSKVHYNCTDKYNSSYSLMRKKFFHLFLGLPFNTY